MQHGVRSHEPLRRMSRIAGEPLTRENRFAANPAKNLLIGLAIGLLWAPCAGPILGLLIVVASRSGGIHATALFFTFALGAGMALGILMNLGGRVLDRVRRAGAAESIIRRTLGIGTTVTVVAIFFGWDSALFAKGGVAGTAHAEARLVKRLAPALVRKPDAGLSLDEFAAANAAVKLNAGEGSLASFDGATEWINSRPLTLADLRGKVVLVQFWTFACYNCLNAMPHVKALEAKYRDKGLVVIGVHTPELPHERVLSNVRNEVKRLGITYPVVIV